MIAISKLNFWHALCKFQPSFWHGNWILNSIIFWEGLPWISRLDIRCQELDFLTLDYKQPFLFLTQNTIMMKTSHWTATKAKVFFEVFYRPHPKVMESNVFSLFTPGGGGYSKVTTPPPSQGRYSSFGQVRMGVPQGTYPLAKVSTPTPGQVRKDGGKGYPKVPIPGSGWGKGTQGYLPPGQCRYPSP